MSLRKIMAVNFEIKGIVARLLATENLTIHHKRISTACFDPNARVLTLPLWDLANDSVYDMLVAHEVAHALYSPNVDLNSFDAPASFLNVLEDVRVEKLIKRRYNGLHKSFYFGYKEILKLDFFDIKDKDVKNLPFIDRINLHFKVGNFLDVFFDENEKEIIKQIENIETFEQVKEISKFIFESIPKSNEVFSGALTINELTEKEISKTLECLNLNLESLISPYDRGLQYLEAPDINLSSVIVNNNEIFQYIESDCPLDQLEYGYLNYKRSAQQEVNYLVKEFECKKAASLYSKSMTSRTGVLDCSKLHSYSFNDDIFLKTITLPEAKNHGLIFVLDWSGSMARNLLDTLKQLYNLIWFCKNVSIPFEVYAFTNEWNKKGVLKNITGHYEKKSNLLSVRNYFNLLNFFTSSVSKRVLDHQMKIIWNLVNKRSYSLLPKLSLSGTPLNESLISLFKIIPEFKKKYGIEKTHCIILTDGEANSVNYHAERKLKEGSEVFIGERYIPDNGNLLLRDPKLKTTYKILNSHSLLTTALLRNLRDRFSDVNFISISIMNNSGFNKIMKLYYSMSEFHKIKKEWNRNKSFFSKKLFYNAFFGLSSSSIFDDAEFEVSPEATRTQIKSAFIKSLKRKSLNKKILTEFVNFII